MLEALDIMMWEISAETPWVMPLSFALFGACVGSFLNVVIYRLPLGLSVNEPRRSFCPTCRTEIPWYLNIPLLSWLMLGGKSACCKQKIPVRYWLVELVCALFFAATAYLLGQEQSVSFAALVSICVWGAATLAILCIDWEQMIVLPSLTLIAAGAGLVATWADPWNLYGCNEAEDAIVLSLGSAVGVFVLLKLIGLIGKLLFGGRRKEYGTPQRWTLHQKGDDLELTVGSDSYCWSELFMENGNRMRLEEATICTHPGCAKGALRFTAETCTLPDGTVLALEDYDSLEGECLNMDTRREALGSGDAWIALAIGTLCGWMGTCFALVAGSVLGLVWALVAGLGRGKAMPFGPVFIIGAWLYLFWGRQLVEQFLPLN